MINYDQLFRVLKPDSVAPLELQHGPRVARRNTGIVSVRKMKIRTSGNISGIRNITTER